MARYIDAGTAIRLIEIDALLQFGYSKRDAIDCIKATPTADVVPRAMIAEIFKEIEKIRAKEIHKCETLREKESDPSERKYWEGGYNSLRQLSYCVAVLKKKYTGEGGE